MNKVVRNAVFVCFLLSILFLTPSTVIAAEESSLEDTSQIDFPSYMREGASAELGTNPQTQDERKIVSVLGDSIGTYEGYTPWNIFYYYYCSQYMGVSETWWMHYIEANNMKLGVNESLGGSKVAWWEEDPSGYNSKQCMAAEERIARLDDNGTPDVILFFGGTNDIATTALGEFLPGENIGDVSTFNSAYQTALVRLQEHYPAAEIICLTPYYRDISSWSDSTNADVDLYADSIVAICQYYGVQYVDLRQADIDEREDMCGWDYLHVNEKGHNKIWHMLKYNQPALISKGINILQNNNNVVHAEYQVYGASSNTEYQWQVYDCNAKVWILCTEWSNNNTFSYEPVKSGPYWIYCTARNNLGEEVSTTTGISVVLQPIIIDGFCWIYQETEIQIGIAYSSSSPSSLIRWQSYNLDTKKWDTISDWSTGNWSSWKPKKGNYWLHAEIKDNKGRIVSHTINFAVGRNYPVCISGKYQGPNPYGEGWLLGVSSNINPEQKYQYEMLILDCNKYVSGNPNPWIYGTGLARVSSGTTFWTTYNPPQGGYYWTYFRIYDQSGNMIEDQCYGALF